MKIEYSLKHAGLTAVHNLKAGQFFINGGLMNSPQLYMVVNPASFQMFNLTKSRTEMWSEQLHKLVAVVNVKVVVGGYASMNANPPPEEEKKWEPDNDAKMVTEDKQLYEVSATIRVRHKGPLAAADEAAQRLKDNMPFFRVRDLYTGDQTLVNVQERTCKEVKGVQQ